MAFQQGLSGLSSSSQALDVISHNVANANTTGFKASQTVFADVYSSTLGADPYKQVGSGSRVAAVRQNFSQGSITETGNSLDMAINGDGFFMVKRPVQGDNQTFYTRAGEFQLDKDGYVITATGYQLLGYPGTAGAGDAVPIQVPYDTGTPRETSQVGLTFNLDASQPVISTKFNPNDPSTYNFQTTVVTYDSLGIPHNLDLFFKKQDPIEGIDPGKSVAAWDVYGKISGSNLSTSTPIARLNFDASGRLITTSGNASATFAVPPPTLAVSATVPVISQPGSDETITIKNQMTGASGISINIGTATSAAAIAAAINAQKDQTGVTATATTTVTLTPSISISDEGSITINGTEIVVNAGDSLDDVVVSINANTGTTGVTATKDGNNLVLSNTDGSNIQISVDGTGVTATIGADTVSIDDDDPTIIYGRIDLSSNNYFVVEKSGSSLGAEPTTGTLVSSTANTVTLNNGAEIGGNGDGILDVTFNATQYSLASSVGSLSQDGVPAGELASVNVTQTGQIQARYTNGNVITVGTVAIASFRNPNGLISMGDNLWSSSLESGPGIAGVPGAGTRGFISGGAVEASNVDLTAELVNMIVQQRAYQANAQSIRTQDQILQTIINLR